MSNLRDLIGYADNTKVQQYVGLSSSANFPRGSVFKQFSYYSQCGPGAGIYAWQHPNRLLWRAPQGTKFIKLEIWGGGGAGAGSQCCSYGLPGNSGAYAYKCLYAERDGDLSGCPYEFCIGYGGCCQANLRSDGYQGQKTFALGHGLSNFCAEGGYHGLGWCKQSSFCCFCIDTSGVCAMTNSAGHFTFDGGDAFGGSESHWCDPGGSDNNPYKCWSQGQMALAERRIFHCDHRGKNFYCYIGIGNTFGSRGERIKWNSSYANHCYGGLKWNCMDRAPYFGADGGAAGNVGAIGSYCNQDANDNCMIYNMIPYPGGIINTYGGWWHKRMEVMLLAGSQANGRGDQPTWFYGAGSGDCQSNVNEPWPGVGGPTAVSYCCNNCCYCGSAGGNGMIRVTFG